ncbi:hypothetical protein ACLOJK_028022 [Asimina triloba]
MDEGFQFDAASSDEEVENEVGKEVQSPWEFTSYSESVAEEHAHRSTTSLDSKISKLLQERPITLPDEDDDDDGDDDGSGGGSGDDNDDANASEPVKRKSNNARNANDGNASGGTNPFFAPSEGTSFSANSFIELNLSRPLLRSCEALGYHKPTPIQAACIPLALTGRDICGSAITGSGKTAAFTLPVLERLLFRPKRIHAIRVLVLTPTRELAAQWLIYRVHSMIAKLAQFTDIRSCLVVGGLSTKVQEAALRSMPDIVVATPGRMIDHLRNSQSVALEDLAVLILDEADRLLELGFSAEIRELIRLCPKRRQTMLFSATMTEEIDELIKLSLTRPMRLSADPSTKRPATLTEEVVRIRRMREANQEAVLLALCLKTFTKKVIIFSGTKQAAHRLKILFGLAGLKAAELHGNLTQVQRLDALELFRKQEVDFLIATDVAARGLDIIGVQTVINFACPRDITSYVHRVGRTARAGREGYAVTFVSDNDRSLLKAIDMLCTPLFLLAPFTAMLRAKRAGSTLKNRIVAEQSILKWSQMIEQLEDQVAEILQEEREERALRKAEMEAMKAENMIEHKDDIFSRPKRTWFATEKEKKLIAKAAKESKEKGQGSENEVMSAQQAEDLKTKEKRQREREKHMPRKKRRRLQAAREMLEDESQSGNSGQGHGKGSKDKAGKSLVELGYKQAKSVKAIQKAGASGKTMRKLGKPSHRSQGRGEEMKELFQADMSDRKQMRLSKIHDGGARKKSKHSFKSKSRQAAWLELKEMAGYVPKSLTLFGR